MKLNKNQKKTTAEFKRILVCRTDRLGDVVLSTPVVKILRDHYPSAHIAFLCRPYTRQVLAGNPYLDEVIVYDKYRKQKSFLATLKFALFLGKKKFDLALILHPTNRMHMVTFFAKIPKRVGWGKKMAFLLTDKLDFIKDQGKKHESEYNFDILACLGITAGKETKTNMPLTKESELKVKEILEEKKLEPGQRLVVIHPLASCISKRWPQANFLKLISLLQKRKEVRVALIAAPDQVEFTKLLAAEKGVIDLSGKLSISETAALLKKAVLFVSCDSGPVHIASALEVPVISIFGRLQPGLSPLRWRPLGKNAHYLHKNIGCKMCLAHNCLREFACLKAISPEEVYALASRILDSSLG